MGQPVEAGSLLVASVGLSDGVFDQTVVLLLDADESGSLGVVLNRVASIDVGAALPQWADLLAEPAVMFAGGPVSPNGAICLAAPRFPDEEPPGWRRLFGQVGLLHLDTPVELAQGAYDDLRVYAGYAGWAPGQLQGELLRGMWHVVPSHYEDVFDSDPETLWRRVLRRQGGDVAVFSTWTADPEEN